MNLLHHQNNIKVYFSKEPPKIAELNFFFKDAGWHSSESFIKETITAKPHSLLTTIWISLQLNNQPIGMARLYLPPKMPANAPAFIGDVIIIRQHQSKGYGAHLIQIIDIYCMENNVLQIILEPNIKSEGFWKSMGFYANKLIPNLLFRDILQKNREGL